ncbi:MAG: CBS domain-containing protein [Candidatus Methanofastidiosia archaeon]
MKLSEIKAFEILRKPLIISDDEPVSKALGMMKKHRAEEILLRNESIGVLTLRDILGVTHPEHTKVSKLKSKTPTFSKDSSLEEIAEAMLDANLSCIPILDKGKPLGIITYKELLETILEFPKLENTSCLKVMKPTFVTISESEYLSKARGLMIQNNINHLPVLREKEVVGMIHLKNLVFKGIQPISKMTTGDLSGVKVDVWRNPVSGFMSKRFLKVNPKTTVRKVVEKMLEISEYFCIVFDRKRLGIITPREILFLVLERRARGLLVHFTGLDEIDSFERASIERKISRVLRRYASSLRLKNVSVRLKVTSKTGRRNHYFATIKIFMPYDSIRVSAQEWGALKVFDVLCERLDGKLRQEKEMRK